MSTLSQSLRTKLMMSFALEASLSAWGLWSLVAQTQMGWKTGAVLFTVSLLAIQAVRTMRAIKLVEGLDRDLRRALVGMAISVAGWIAMIVLFALITLYPELEVPTLYLAPAFLCHIGGALLAMHALKQTSPPEDLEKK